MSTQTDGIRIGFAILLLIVAAAFAPVLDEIAGFLSEAPYVRLLPAPEHAGVLISAISTYVTVLLHD